MTMIRIPFYDVPKAPTPDALDDGHDPAAIHDEASHAAAQEAAKRADIAVVDQVEGLLHGGPEPFMATEGDKATARALEVWAEINGLSRKARDSLPPPARPMFDDLYNKVRLPGWSQDVTAHAQAQAGVARNLVSDTRRDQALAGVRRELVTNPARAAEALHFAFSETHTSGERNGQPPGQTAETWRALRADALAGGVEQAIDRRVDLDQIQTAHDAARDQMDPARARAIDARLHALRAEQDARSLAPVLASQTASDGRPAPRDLGEALAAARDAAGEDPVRRAAFAQAVAERWRGEAQDRAAARARALGELHPHLLDLNIRSAAALPRELVQALPADTAQAMRDFYARGGRFAPVSDPEAALALDRLAVEDPAAFAELDPTALTARLTRAAFTALPERQAAAREDAPDFRLERADLRRRLAIGDKALADAPETGIADDPAREAAFHADLADSIALYRRDNAGKAPDEGQIASMARAILTRGLERETIVGGSGDDTLLGAAGSAASLRPLSAAATKTDQPLAHAAVHAGHFDRPVHLPIRKPGPLDPLLESIGVTTGPQYDSSKYARHILEGKIEPAEMAEFLREQADANRDRPQVQAEPDLGRLARGAETSEWGTWRHRPGDVSTGAGDKGGVSYGSYQLASKMGIPADFLLHQGKPWAARFGEQQQGTEAFTKTWKQIAKEDPVAFARAQHEYVMQYYYLPQAKIIKRVAGIDLSQRSVTLRNVILSTAVQMSPSKDTYARVIKSVNDAKGGKATDEQIIDAIYAKRFPVDAGGNLINFKSSPKNKKGILERKFSEPRAAYEMLRQELAGERFALDFAKNIPD